jgi:hypothetical protein
MSATGPGSEHFGWPSFYEEPEAYFTEQEEAKLRFLAEVEERRAQQAAQAAVNILRQRGLLREDRLSYTRICELEHETGIFIGSWADYLQALHEAELKDRELWKS